MKKPFPPLWMRYFLKKTSLQLLLLFSLFSLLYMGVDYALRAEHLFISKEITMGEIVTYYGAQIGKRLSLLLPLSLLLATLLSLSHASEKGEILSLQTAGVSLQKVVSPWLFLSVGIGALLGLHLEYTYPKAISYTEHFERLHLSAKKERSTLCSFSFEGGPFKERATLIYTHYDPSLETFSHALWIPDIDTVWRIHTLKRGTPHPVGIDAEKISWNPSRSLWERSTKEPLVVLKDLPWPFDPEAPLFIPYDDRPLSSLLNRKGENSSPSLMTYRSHKLLIPLYPLLFFLGIVPYSTRFSRKTSLFTLYGGSLCAFLLFYLLMHSSVILGTSKLYSPHLPFYLFTPLFLWALARFIKEGTSHKFKRRQS